MKTIKDAVIELGGKWPEIQWTKDVYFSVGDLLIDKRLAGDNAVICNREQFESTAKSMGYINGYLWGKECPTNGKRPDLPDDVLVQIKHDGIKDWLTSAPVDFWAWSNHLKGEVFKITDPRYKPVDEVSEISKSKDFEMKVSEAEQNNSWHERGEFPPVGVECEFLYMENWHPALILAADGDAVWVKLLDNKYKTSVVPERFRPIRTHREKVIEAARAELKKMDLPPEAFAALFDAGMLNLPNP